MFAKSLQKLLELKEGEKLKEGGKFNKLFITDENGKVSINGQWEFSNPLDRNDGITLYKYLMYLYAGALAGAVNIITMEKQWKGLNRDILKMSNEDFKNFLKGNDDLMNNSFLCIGKAKIDTPTKVFNGAINELRKEMNNCVKKNKIIINNEILTNINKEFWKKFYGIKECYRGLYYPSFPRFYFNIKRGLKKLFGCQDFSYASKEYKKIFENIFNTLDSTKESNKIKK